MRRVGNSPPFGTHITLEYYVIVCHEMKVRMIKSHAIFGGLLPTLRGFRSILCMKYLYLLPSGTMEARENRLFFVGTIFVLFFDFIIKFDSNFVI